jgi:hypothetical protein
MTPEEVEEAIGYTQWIITWRTNAYEAYLLDPVIALYWCHTRQVHREALVSLANVVMASRVCRICRYKRSSKAFQERSRSVGEFGAQFCDRRGHRLGLCAVWIKTYAQPSNEC